MTFISSEKIINCSWYEFERKIFRLLQHAGWTDLMFTSKSHDEGADLVGYPPKGNSFVIVQCKHTRASSIGKRGIEDLIRACQYYDTKKGIIATNAKLSSVARDRKNEVKNQFNFLEWNLRRIGELGKNISEYSSARKKPYEFQQTAIDEILRAFSSGSKSALAMFATGLGKSIILSEVAHDFTVNKNQKVLLLADKLTLIEQLESSIWSQIPAHIDTRLWGGGKTPSSFEGVTIATQQSVSAALSRGEKLPYFSLIMVDECHHALSPTFSQLLVDLNPSYLLGVTATPWRGDQRKIAEIFGNPVATMGIVEGIEKGYLADVEYKMFADNIDWDIVADNSKKRMSIKDLNAKLFIPSRDEIMCGKIIEEWNANNRPQMITFCKGIDHAERLAQLFNAMGLSSRAVHSREMAQAERAKHIMDFKVGIFSNLIGVDILNEGIDVPDVGMIIFARVTHSRRIFIQQMGRGLRTYPGKKYVTVLDFVADIRRIGEGFRLNQERSLLQGIENYRGPSSEMVKFHGEEQGRFVESYLADVADLEDSDKIRLNFINPIG